MKYERKAFSFEVKQVSDAGEIEGYASVFGVKDLGGDTVMRGAFQSAQGKTVPMLWNHDPSQPIGVWDRMSEDERGLRVSGKMVMEVSRARETHALMQSGAIKGLSIGYRTKGYDRDGNGRKLTDLDLMEISAVTFPMLPDAQVTAVKSDSTIRDWEAFLRDAGGLSRQEAKAFCANGFKALAALRDEADEGIDADRAQLLDLLKTFGR